MKNVLCGPVVAVVVFLLSVVGSYGADTLRTIQIDINGDCVADTLYSVGTRSTGYALSYVNWGIRDSVEYCDSTFYSDTARSFHARSVFTYPGLDSITSSVVRFRLNGDNWHDLLVSIKGTITVPPVAPDTLPTYADTVVVIGLLSQHGLDTLDTMELQLDSGVVTSPWVRVYLSEGNGITRERVSARALCAIQTIDTVDLDVDVVDTTTLEKVNLTRNPDLKSSGMSLPSIVAYPNPTTGTSIEVALTGFKPPCRIVISNVHGEQQARHELNSLNNSRTSIPIGFLPSGMYAVVAIDDSGNSASTVIVVKR
ncbi:MAG: T9SS type A sorting domain-containing protein [Ignavibacteria bacterium]|nr:T9SS type A sorting domain-containing protein [Ignavibacteria bacterium]MBK7186053.1 T9SS type A sorting domain-containing protein [Ignavibacteria bacterium]MBK7577356.1 T9SS type A sorting domain-containing protein [Ignavibacteria bacterium]MBK9183242.1 T9SS type A sorting domain-containing protein [Ignavibacteria bacterium]MBL0322603.1 T9SS type A sorting domain-containing protein [Ignavibacteria bacterium]